mgnify:CR=1 FL=1
MSEILTAGGIMFGIALVFGTVLAVAYRWLRVYEDPRIDEVEARLPGSNCGACGQPGCRAFAEAIVAGRSPPAGCSVSSPDAIATIAEYLGVEAGELDRKVARLQCAGGISSVEQLATYRGIPSCRGAFTVNGGGRACSWGCLGLGDCDVACTFDAIRMGAERLPIVAVDLCTACGDCVDVCPVDLFVLLPLSQQTVVQCSSPLTGDAARAACSVACDACGRCALDASPGAIEMEGGLPVIRNPSLCVESCTWRCPTGAIQWVTGGQFGAAPQASAAAVEARHG